jgi:ribosomal protein L21
VPGLRPVPGFRAFATRWPCPFFEPQKKIKGTKGTKRGIHKTNLTLTTQHPALTAPQNVMLTVMATDIWHLQRKQRVFLKHKRNQKEQKRQKGHPQNQLDLD